MKHTTKPKLTLSECMMYVKRFVVLLLGSLFVQIVLWAFYSYLELPMLMFATSAVVTALLYHGIQMEEETGLSRKAVFFAGILIPFFLSLLITIGCLIRYPNLTLLGANADEVSPMTELIALVSARLLINGVLLLLFALADAFYLRGKHKKSKQSAEAET